MRWFGRYCLQVRYRYTRRSPAPVIFRHAYQVLRYDSRNTNNS